MKIGARIKEIFDNMPKGYTVVKFAHDLHCDRTNVYQIFKRDNIDIQLLKKISIVLNHDFFTEISQQIADNIDKKC